MPETIENPWIKLKSHLNRDDYHAIHTLEELCIQNDGISLKLELEYKLEDAANMPGKSGIDDIDEYLYFAGDTLIGYIGICGFGGAAMPLEITGMVHPEYRRMGVFSRLHTLVKAECARRNAVKPLGLCDRNSVSGRGFLRSIGAEYQCAEFEMSLYDELLSICEEQLLGVNFRKATNADAAEIARQNRIFFPEEAVDDGGDQPDKKGLLPEEEEKRGMTIYMAETEGQIIGKANLELLNGAGGIYGLGVLPEFRGRGYGRAVLLHAIQILKNRNANSIKLQVSVRNEKALGLYQSCGFRQTSVMEYFRLL